VVNALAQREYLTTIFTFYGALFFVISEFSNEIQLIVFVAIILSNFWFLILWVYLVITQFKHRHAQIIAKFIGHVSMHSTLRQEEFHYVSKR
jgi:dolichol kinase